MRIGAESLSDELLLTTTFSRWQKKGVVIMRSRVTDLEFYDDRVIVYSESTNS